VNVQASENVDEPKEVAYTTAKVFNMIFDFEPISQYDIDAGNINNGRNLVQGSNKYTQSNGLTPEEAKRYFAEYANVFEFLRGMVHGTQVCPTNYVDSCANSMLSIMDNSFAATVAAKGNDFEGVMLTVSGAISKIYDVNFFC